MTVTRAGLVLGRFQPFHLGHLEYVEEARVRCDRLFIGVTNPDPEARIATAADPARSSADSNPFTFSERRTMIEASLWELGWTEREFCIIPAPLLNPERLEHYLPPSSSTTAYLTVYDEWGDQKVKMMTELGYEVDVMWRREHSSRVASGTQIRKLLRDQESEAWEALVPKAVAFHIKERALSAY